MLQIKRGALSAAIEQMPAHTKKEHAVHDRLGATQSLFSVIGIMFLWICWYAFNCGSLDVSYTPPHG